jgi:hypothetical protein
LPMSLWGRFLPQYGRYAASASRSRSWHNTDNSIHQYGNTVSRRNRICQHCWRCWQPRSGCISIININIFQCHDPKNDLIISWSGSSRSAARSINDILNNVLRNKAYNIIRGFQSRALDFKSCGGGSTSASSTDRSHRYQLLHPPEQFDAGQSGHCDDKIVVPYIE